MTRPNGLPQLRRNVDAPGTPIVFIHGIKGSLLEGPDGTVHWLTFGAVLGLRTPPLALPIQWKDDVQARDGVIATEPLAAVEVIPGLLRAKVYAPWLKAAASLGRPFYAFAYDWRRDNLENAAGLRACIEAVRARHGGQQIQLVAHSMGGIISLVVLNEHPDWFRHVLFAGVPFRGGIGFLEDMHVGPPTGRNRKLASPEVLFTCPASYTLFPLGRSDCLDADGSPLDLDFFDADSWVREGLGIFADRAAATPERLSFLRWAVGRGKAFRSLLVHRDQPYPPISVLASRAHPTMAIAMRNGPKAFRGWDLYSTERLPGDARVCFEHALPPEGFQYELTESALEHPSILNDSAVPEILRSV